MIHSLFPPLTNIETALSRKRFLVYLMVILISFGCDSENATDCLQTDGDTLVVELSLPSFTKIQMEDDLRVVLKEGQTQKVIVSTGENILDELLFEVREETLILQNNNSCNIFRDYGKTVVTITAPNITFIRNASSFDIRSEGVLNYPSLTLWSNTNPNTLNITDANKNGAFYLSLDVGLLEILANGTSRFELEGTAQTADIRFTDEFPQLYAANLIIQDLSLTHTGAAAMYVNPQERLRGVIRATGDVISFTRPPIVDVDELFTGRLLFEE